MLSNPRKVERLVQGQPTSDGAGVKLLRVLTSDLQQRLDPFLMLDAFGTDNPGDYIAGFPDHPHRGFETVTYMLQGRLRHRDSTGNEGVLAPGGVQWMTAGRGLIHSEMPEQQDGAMEGFQLWLNLPARDKLCPPGYRDIPAAEIPHWQGPGVLARVIAGSCQGVQGAVQRPVTEPLILDLHFEPGATLALPLPDAHNALLYVYRGGPLLAGPAGETAVRRQRMAIFANTPGSDGLLLRSDAQPVRAMLFAGRPLREPIAQYGPFVMNTREELMQAVADFQAGRLA
jgi:redox-sensitive bicupin YhaK (pirin superfamily)